MALPDVVALTRQDTTDVRLAEHDAYAWTGATGEQPVSAEVQRLIDNHFLPARP